LREIEDPRRRWAAITPPTRSKDGENGGQDPPKASCKALAQNNPALAGSTRERERERDASATLTRPITDPSQTQRLSSTLFPKENTRKTTLSRKTTRSLSQGTPSKRLKSTTGAKPQPDLMSQADTKTASKDHCNGTPTQLSTPQGLQGTPASQPPQTRDARSPRRSFDCRHADCSLIGGALSCTVLLSIVGDCGGNGISVTRARISSACSAES
jgi:hypothetical protein